MIYEDMLILKSCYNFEISLQGKAIVLRCQSGFDKMANLFFSRLSPYDAPIRIVTSSLAVLLEKKLGTELNASRTLSIAGSKISLPSLESLNLNSSLVINSQVWFVNLLKFLLVW